MLAKIWAFQRKEWQVGLTHPVSALLRFGRGVALLVSLYFVGKLFSGTTPSQLAPYGGDYFRFVLLGLVFSQLMSSAQGSLSRTIRTEGFQGTLEVILLTPTSFRLLALSKALWDLGVVSLKGGLYLLAGLLLFGADLSRIDWAAAGLTALLTVSTFLGIGLFSAGLVLLLKEASPLDNLLGGLSRFLSGVYFPVAVFPEWVQSVSAAVPLTYSLEAARKAVIQGAGPGELLPELTVLLLLSAVLLPVGHAFFRWSFDRARAAGTLGFEH